MSRRKDPKKTGTAGSKPSVDGSVDALAELAPFSKALASLATREEPERPDAPPEMLAAAYVLRATWLALHRGDKETLHEWAKGAIGYLDFEKNPTSGVEFTVCHFLKLPPIKGVNRPEAIRRLLWFAEEMALRRSTTAPEIARWMASAVGHTFPNLLPPWPARDEWPVEKITAAIERAHRLGKLSPRQLVILSLRVLGMPDTEVASAMKSAENRP